MQVYYVIKARPIAILYTHNKMVLNYEQLLNEIAINYLNVSCHKYEI